MTETERIHKDYTAWLDKYGIELTVTFDCKFDRIIERPASKTARQVTIQWLERVPVHAVLLDNLEREFVWHYGDNMPPDIERALEQFEAALHDDIEQQAMEDR
jgi:hypothetical protein